MSWSRSWELASRNSVESTSLQTMNSNQLHRRRLFLRSLLAGGALASLAAGASAQEDAPNPNLYSGRARPLVIYQTRQDGRPPPATNPADLPPRPPYGMSGPAPPTGRQQSP